MDLDSVPGAGYSSIVEERFGIDEDSISIYRRVSKHVVFVESKKSYKSTLQRSSRKSF